jgi:hypothetical protein
MSGRGKEREKGEDKRKMMQPPQNIKALAPILAATSHGATSHGATSHGATSRLLLACIQDPPAVK